MDFFIVALQRKTPFNKYKPLPLTTSLTICFNRMSHWLPNSMCIDRKEGKEYSFLKNSHDNPLQVVCVWWPWLTKIGNGKQQGEMCVVNLSCRW